jgi:hypothetical protein
LELDTPATQRLGTRTIRRSVRGLLRFRTMLSDKSRELWWSGWCLTLSGRHRAIT